ncbi:Auxin efflux carrier component 2 [Glycine soja]|nr:Auxin efflux carrier component 2 [Glycine soja]
MIKGKDIYEVVAALVPLYLALFLAYGSVRWLKIFTQEQCSGISRFVSVFAVPFLSFDFISSNNPYTMNLRFLAADSLQKIVVLLALFLFNTFTKWGSIDWSITLFSLITLPNTLVMGDPLLKAMYGEFTHALMTQIVVLQSVIWYTLLLVLFEYRGAKLLISEQFPETAGSIATLRVDSSVSSLNGREPLHADAEVGENGQLHVVVRSMSRSVSMASSFHKSYSTGVEIYPFPSSREQTSLQSFGVHESRFWRSKSDGDAVFNSGLVSSFPSIKPVFQGSRSGGQTNRDMSSSDGATSNMGLHMFGWSRRESSTSEVNMKHAVNRVAPSDQLGTIGPSMADDFPHESAASKGNIHYFSLTITFNVVCAAVHELEEIREGIEHPVMGRRRELSIEEDDGNKRQQMPRVSVMIKLILTMVWRNLLRNPNAWASVFGLVWSLIFFRWNIAMPKIVRKCIDIISHTGLGMAMFSLGLFMALQPKIITCGKTRATISLVIRFLIGPAVILATSKAMSIHGVLLNVAIVQAALPQGIVPFVFAKEYNLHPDILSTAVIFGMVVALPVTIIYYVVLGVL